MEQGIEARDKIAERLLAETEIPVPDGVLAQMIEQHFADGHGDEDHREEFAEQTRESLRNQFLLDALADDVDVEVTQDDLTQWIMQQAPRYNMSPDQFVQALVQSDQLSTAMGDVRRAKALSVVLEQAKIVDASGREVDLGRLDDDDELDEDLADPEAEEADELEAEAGRRRRRRRRGGRGG